MARKICVTVTARPSYSRLKSVLQALKKHPDIELQVVVGASALLDRYGSAVKTIENDGFEIAAKVYMVLEGENLPTMAKTTGLGLMELATVLDNLKPDAVLINGDRYEVLATAIAASYMNIPIGHIMGGEVSGSLDEKVRHAVTKLSNLHFVSSAPAAERVIKMGEDPKTVFKTGCPSVDIARKILDNPNLDFDPLEKYGGVGASLDLSKDYIVVLHHPVTTEYELARQHVKETLYGVHKINIPTLWFWPNVDAGSDGTSKGIRTFREEENPKNFHFFKNMAPEDFLRLIYNSKCIVGNSSVAIRECAFLGVPAVNIGTRQSGRDRGKNVLDVGYKRQEIESAIRKQTKIGRFDPDPLYGDGLAGERIAKLFAEEHLTYNKRLHY